MTRLLVLGINRSGTSWVGETLGATTGATYVSEPDGDHDPWAYRVRRARRADAGLVPGAPGGDSERLWAGAFAGGARPRGSRAALARRIYARSTVTARWEAWLGGRETIALRWAAALARPRVASGPFRHVVVKSVRAEADADWIAARFRPTVVVVERHPLNVLASWSELGFVRDPREAEWCAARAQARWGIAPPDLRASLLGRQAFTFGVRAGILREVARDHGWIVVRHEELCADPAGRFAALAGDLGLEWSARARDHLAASDRAGTGYETRRCSAHQADRWRTRLQPEQVEEIRSVLTRLPHDLLAPG